MNFAVIGGGAIGSLIAGFLCEAGIETMLIGRQEHVDAIKERGLRIKMPEGIKTIAVPADVRLRHKYDAVIFCVKTQDLEDAYQENHSFLENCECLTTQNGVQGANILSTHFDRTKMIDSIVMFGSTYVHPGEITYNFPGEWVLGRPYAPLDPQFHAVADILKKIFSVVVTDDIQGMKWLKIFVNFNNCLPALIGKSMQETYGDMDFCRLSIMLLKEGVEIVQAAGIPLESLPRFPAERIYDMASLPVEDGARIIHKTLTSLSQEPLYGSILQSILRGRTTEIDFINGEVEQVAVGLQMKAPLNRKIVDMVHQVENSGRFFNPGEIKKEFGLI